IPDADVPPLRAIVLFTNAGPWVEPLKKTTPPLHVPAFCAMTFWTTSASVLLVIQIVPPSSLQSVSVAVLPVIVLSKIRGVPAKDMPIALPLPARFPTNLLLATTAAPPPPWSDTPPPQNTPVPPRCEQSARLLVNVLPVIAGDPSMT